MEELIAQIERAFAGVPYPGDDALTSSSYGDEPQALVEAFRGRTDWRTLDASFLDQAPDGWASALSFFSAGALHFYLPAYLIADLRGQLASADPTSRLCLSLTPQVEGRRIAQVFGGGTLGDHARCDFDRFDAAQATVIVAYLRWRLTADAYAPHIEQALQAYWLARAG